MQRQRPHGACTSLCTRAQRMIPVAKSCLATRRLKIVLHAGWCQLSNNLVNCGASKKQIPISRSGRRAMVACTCTRWPLS